MYQVLLSLAFFTGCSAARTLGGGTLSYTYNKFVPAPLTALQASSNSNYAFEQNFQQYADACDANLGIAYTVDGAEPTPTSPITLYYTSYGQIAGFGVTAFGGQDENLVNEGYWIKQSSIQDFISISFRNSSAMCSDEKDNGVLGDRVVVNQGAESGTIDIPLDYDDATAAGWDIYGSSFPGMGVHASYNIDANDEFDYQFSNASLLLPVVAMYQIREDGSRGPLTSVFILSTVAQDDDGGNSTYPASSDKFFDGPYGGGSSAWLCNNWCAGSGTLATGLTTVPEGTDISCDYGDTTFDTFHWQFYKPESDEMDSVPTPDRTCGGTYGMTKYTGTDTSVNIGGVVGRCCYPESVNLSKARIE